MQRSMQEGKIQSRVAKTRFHPRRRHHGSRHRTPPIKHFLSVAHEVVCFKTSHPLRLPLESGKDISTTCPSHRIIIMRQVR
jgi:hypothetical protein